MGPRIRNRACAVIVQDGKVLLVQHQKNDQHYWLFPGGGVEFGETLQEAVAREMMEETNLDVEVGELIMVSESIPPDKHRHVINYYFLATVVGGEMKLGDDKYLFDLQWHPMEKLPGMMIFPAVAPEIVQRLQDGADLPVSIGNKWD
ncbi:MAG: NUDIX hydrolase [Candidatus Hinthialibacter antarcticus]|nr:NUDIX hydrolase [Candidatus Hinthialibacter antarcticus]